MDFVEKVIPVDRMGALAWQGGALVDWFSGRRYVPEDGSQERFGSMGGAYRFDSVVGMDDWAVIFEALGTKGVLVRDNGKRPEGQWWPLGFDILREIDRSYYSADCYSFPVTLFRLPDERPVIAHCPRGYDVIDVELMSGECLTPRPTDSCKDVFHSRLQASPDGRWLLSNGWVWHPANVIGLYSVDRALNDPLHLSSYGVDLDRGEEWRYEETGAVFVGDRLVLATEDDVFALAIVDLETLKTDRVLRLDEPPGTRLMALGRDHILSTDGKPKVIELATGRIVHRFEHLNGGPGIHQPCQDMDFWEPPHVALDPLGGRFAVGSEDQIAIVTWRP